MKKPLEGKEEPFLLTLTDFIRVLKKKKHLIWFGTLACALFALYYGLTKPIEYQAEGSFKEKGKSSSGINRSVTAAVLLGVDGDDSDALMMMKSRKLTEQLVKQLGLQGIISKDEGPAPLLPWQTIQQNLLVEYALFNKAKRPVLEDFKEELNLSNISYQKEFPTTVRLFFKTENDFDIIDSDNQLISQGTLGKPISSQLFTATIKQNIHHPLSSNEYYLTLLPLGATAESLSKQFVVENDRFDKSLIKISYKHRNRHQAVKHVNALMDVYQDYIQTEHARLCALQIDYLVQRQKEMGEHLEAMMRNYANDQSCGLSSTGFATSDNAINFLASNQQGYKQKLMAIDLEIQQIEHAQNQGKMGYDKLMLVQNAETVNNLTTEIRTLKQQADSLDLALHDQALERPNFHQSFVDQIAELEEVKICSEEAKSLLADLQQDRLQTPPQHLIDHPKFMVKAWYERLQESKKLPNNMENTCKNGMLSYINHLVHYLNVHQKSIEERLAHQQLPLNEFQGINPSTAEDLYISYSRELNELESKTAQQRFIIDHINDPDFEISSLSTLLNDPVSAEMISNASSTVLALRDMDNRSGREQDRLRADLAIQKSFLATHLKQAIQLSELHQNLIKENIKDLQSATLSLIQERVSILENHISEFIVERLESLKQEKSFLEHNLSELRQEMASFPQKWVAEQLIHHQMEINQNMVEEISKLVESKNIANNLEKIQSAPVDLPLTPVHPKSPRVLLLTILGGLAGAFISTAFVLIASIARGVEASSENLRLAGQHVSGKINRQYRFGLSEDPLLDNDLDTLRRLIAFTCHDTQETTPPLKHALLLLMGNGPDYAANVAELITKKGNKVLLMDLSFNTNPVNSEGQKNEGLLQYLEKNAHKPQIFKGPFYDTVATGGICRYSSELLSSKKFTDLLNEYLTNYDWVIGYNKASIKSAEAETLLDIFPRAAISVTGETLPQLKTCMSFPIQEKRITFIIA